MKTARNAGTKKIKIKRQKFFSNGGKLLSEFIFRLPTGEEVGSAKNIDEFLQLIKEVPKRSLEFHHAGKHFKPWLSETGYNDLAEEIEKIEASGNELRKRLLNITSDYIKKKKSRKK